MQSTRRKKINSTIFILALDNSQKICYTCIKLSYEEKERTTNDMMTNIMAEGEHDVFKSIETIKDAKRRGPTRELYYRAIKRIYKGK